MQPALIGALQRGTIKGPGLDVFAARARVPGERIRLENAVLFAHIGSATTGTRATMTAMCKGNPDLWFAGRGTRFRIRCPFDLRNEGWEQAIERHGMIPDARRRRDGERPGAAMRARFGARSEPETGAAIRPADATLRGFGLPPRFSERGEAAFAAVIDRHGDLGHSALILTPRPDQAPGHARSDR